MLEAAPRLLLKAATSSAAWLRASTRWNKPKRVIIRLNIPRLGSTLKEWQSGAVSDQQPDKARDLANKIGAQFHSADNDEVIGRPEVNADIVSTSEGEHLAPENV